MAEKGKISQRDSTLVNILERMADQLQKQDNLLEGVVKQQLELSRSYESLELRIAARQNDVTAAVEKLQESFSRYRSDMLSLVNEQDHINKNTTELSNLVNKALYSVEQAANELTELGGSIKTQEKLVQEHYEHSLKQSENLPKEIAESNRSITKLHMDSEKNLGKMHQDTQRQLERLQQETTRRLLLLGNIESELQTLLIRTEPHDKRPNWLVRAFRRAIRFCQVCFSRLLRVIRTSKEE